MNDPRHCEECEAIQQEFRDSSPELQEMWGNAVSRIAAAANRTAGEIADDLLEKYRFRRGCESAQAPYPGIARAFNRLSQHQLRTGHNPLLRR